MKRWLPLVFALAAVAIYFPPLSAQRPVFTTGTAAELARARSIGLDHLRVVALQKGIDDANDLAVSNAHVDRLSMAHVRVQQRFQGVPVLGGEAIAHLNADGSQFADTDNLVAAIDVSTRPTLTADAAIDVAVADYGCRSCLTRAPTADLWIVRDEAGADHLTYRVQMTRIDGTDQTALPVRFVDAHGGYVVLAYDNLQTATGSSLYSGTVPIETSYSVPLGNQYVMENLTRRVGTFDLRNGWGGSGFRFLDPDDLWSDPAQRAGVDAHYGAEKYLDYLQSTFGRNGIDGKGGPFARAAHDGSGGLISALVHYGSGYNNAFWDGFVMTYGDGDGVQFSPLVTLDIAGHEMTHGVTQYSANLTYYGESGALNEATSDIFGAMTERFVQGESSNTWLLGEQAWTPGMGGDALRYMDEPHRADNKGYTADDDPDHYSERYTGYFDNAGVHINSGIANKAFYLLAHGGTHHRGGSMSGIGADAAARIWFTALTSYMTSSTDFAGARTATTLAAIALYGAGSLEQRTVSSAWCLVGVGTCADVVSVSPNSGSGVTQTFTLLYSDPLGASDIVSARVRFGASNVGPGTCTVWYKATTGVVQLLDDAGSAWDAGTIGSGTLANSQCTVNLASSSVASSGSNLTVVWNITFSFSFAGLKNIYMLASDSKSRSTGWQQRGTWTGPMLGANVISVTPDAGSGGTQAFTLRYWDSYGAADLTSARVRFGSSNVGPGTCSVRYSPITGLAGLLNDAGDAWAEGTFGSGTLANSQCTVDLASSSAAASGDDLTVVLNITFSGAFAGSKQIYMLANGNTGSTTTGWLAQGTWTVPGPGPSPLSVTPNTGSGRTQAFSLRYSDTNGATTLTSARVRFGASNVGPATCTAWYNPMAATISLLNDAGTTWTAGTLGIGTLANSQCTLNLASSSAITNGNDVIVTLNITFTASFHGLKNIYMQAADSGTSSGWVQRGTWKVPVAVVSAISVTPSFGASTREVFTLAYSDTLGAGDLASVRVRFASSNVGPGTCTVSYSPMTGVVQLLGDNGSTWTAGTMGSGTLANSQCTLNLGSSSATPIASTLTLVLDITFDASFAGQKSIYMLAASSEGPNTGWQQRGVWTVMIPTTNPISALPQFGAATTQTFALTYFDSLGAFDLSSARVRFAASNVGPGTCTARYNTGTGTIELLDDAGASWQPATLGNGTLANSQCSLNLAESTASVDGHNVTLALNITFASSFIGLKNIYMLAANSSGLSSGWFVKGTWTPNPDPASHAPIELGALGGTNSIAYKVNASGQVAGTAYLPGDATYHAFSWTQAAGMVDLGTFGGANSSGVALNAAGQIVGYSDTAVGEHHAFSWTQSGGMVDLGTFGGTYSYAAAMNANGQVVGSSATATNAEHAFLWTQAGGMVDLGTLSPGPNPYYSYSIAYAVNDSGQVVGQSNSRPFSWTQAGGMVDLGGSYGYASAVNNSGQVVGYRPFNGGNHAFSWTEAGGMVDLGTLGGFESAAEAVNDSGQVVGYSFSAGSGYRAFSWTQAGGMISLGTLGGSESSAYAVSANGQVVGVSTVADGSYHAFSWTQAGGMVDLGTLGGPYSTAYALNDNCQVVGHSTTAGNAQGHATMWNIGPCN